MGCVSALGADTDAMAVALRDGKCGIGPLTFPHSEELQIKVGAEVTGFDPLKHFDEKKLMLLDRCAQFAVVAARQAAQQSGLDFRSDIGTRTAMIVGVGVGGMGTLDDSFRRLYIEGGKRAQPFTIPKLMISAPGSHVCMDLGIKGPSFTVASACASANHAIGVAYHMVRAGSVEFAVTGGAEAVFSLGAMKGWEAMRILAPDTCRPFSRSRSGLVIGEGAGMVVLENWDHAKARGADILGEIVGFGMSSDAGDIVMPSLEGAAAAMQDCLTDSKLAPQDVQYINAHGTGTAANDITETKAIHTVFGEHARKLSVSSTKSMHGHALGAAGAIELAATLIALRDGFIPPTANYLEPDPQCDLDYVPNVARSQRVHVAMSNSFAFGGLNAILALRRE
jgi:nodulation protein E